jgi:hypothetical protein
MCRQEAAFGECGRSRATGAQVFDLYSARCLAIQISPERSILRRRRLRSATVESRFGGHFGSLRLHTRARYEKYQGVRLSPILPVLRD